MTDAIGTGAFAFPRPWRILVIVFLTALVFVPRFLDLDRFINIDGSLRWFPRSVNFFSALARGDFEGTLQSSHPGVTVMIMSGTSIIAGSIIKYGSASPWEHATDLVFFAKFPIALITGLGLLAVGWFFAREVARPAFALLAVCFLALDPLFLAHSRYFQLDATNAVFVVLALLMFSLYYLNGNQRQLYSSGVFTGLALLTRTTSLAIVPYVIGLCVLRFIRNPAPCRREIAKQMSSWLAITTLVFVTLWPAMWVAPVKTLRRLVGSTENAYKLAHEGTLSTKESEAKVRSESRFSGKLINDFVAHRFPSILVCGCLGIAALFIRHGTGGAENLDHIVLCLLGFGVFLLFGLSFFRKAVTVPLGFRYALVSFVIFQVMAAYGVYRLSSNLWRRQNPAVRFAAFVLPLALCFWTGYRTLSLHPYYQVYQNDLVSAPHSGWGEGLELVAEYLNSRDDAEQLVVASDFASVLGYYFKGHVIWSDQAAESDVDYYVLYKTGVQPELIERLLASTAKQPEFVAVLHGVEYAWLFRGDADDLNIRGNVQ